MIVCIYDSCAAGCNQELAHAVVRRMQFRAIMRGNIVLGVRLFCKAMLH